MSVELPDIDESGRPLPTEGSGKLGEKLRYPVRLDQMPPFSPGNAK